MWLSNGFASRALHGGDGSAKPTRLPATIAHVLALKHLGSGKVRDIYEIDDARLLIVASDRISAFDVVLPNPIPDKGRVLTGLSQHWFGLLDTPHHLLSTDVGDDPQLDARPAAPTGRAFDGRAQGRGDPDGMRRARLPLRLVVEGVRRRRWPDHRAPTRRGSRWPIASTEPIFTPATKAEIGPRREPHRGGGEDLRRRRALRSAARLQHRHLHAGRRLRSRARHPPRRHQVRVRARRRRDHPHRRGADP